MDRLKNETGRWIEDEQEIGAHFVQYFETLFHSGGNCDMEPVTNLVQRRLTNDMMLMLAVPFRREEVSSTLLQMHPNKGPGRDRMNALFYQHFW